MNDKTNHKWTSFSYARLIQKDSALFRVSIALFVVVVVEFNELENKIIGRVELSPIHLLVRSLVHLLPASQLFVCVFVYLSTI